MGIISAYTSYKVAQGRSQTVIGVYVLVCPVTSYTSYKLETTQC